MQRTTELSFLRSIMRNLNINTRMWPSDSSDIDDFDLGIRRYVDSTQQYLAYIKEYSPVVEEKVLYTLTDVFGFSYMIFMHPDEENIFMMIGPFFQERPNRKRVLSIAERFRVDPSRLDGFIGLYDKVPVAADRDMLISIVSSYLSLLWEDESFPVKELEARSEVAAGRESMTDVEKERLYYTERSYKSENELMHAVSRGDTERVRAMLRRFDFGGVAVRNSDLVRNIKNYGIIMNTLLRKAAEAGSVHPVYLDKVSGRFAREIEECRTSADVERILCSMPEAYADLVRKQGLGNVPPIIEKAMMMTAMNISRPVTLSLLADELGLSPSYLSRLWRKETGSTLTAYIRKEKVKSAEQLLLYTDLRIETVAELTGYPDLCYFSRVYKRETGMTPSETRRKSSGRII